MRGLNFYSSIFILALVFGLIVFVRLLLIYLKLSNSDYEDVSGNNLWSVAFNTGTYGELSTFYNLERLKSNNKILTNIYIPKKDGKTTEIDILMINPTGIYVFESKNYSGWIFGDENSKMWTQTLKNGKKNRFYNPIWQNKGHISALDEFLNKQYSNLVYSYIVFSERCELKKITIKSSDIKVINRYSLNNFIKKDIESKQNRLSEMQINEIYRKLEVRTLVNKVVKDKHIQDIKAEHK